jgi:phosphoglycerate dehydrogenase-like enzyme
MIDGPSEEAPLKGILISAFQFSSTSQQILREAAQTEVVCITCTEEFRTRLHDEDSPLYTMQNVIVTPHISGLSAHYDQRLTALFADNVRRYRSPQSLRNRYAPERGY